jgi:leukotriene-A4 hydrolase
MTFAMPKISRSTMISVLSIALVFAGIAHAGALKDPNSYANFQDVRIKDVNLDLTVSFEKKQLSGFAELSLDWKSKKARELVLDTRNLKIQSVQAIDANSRFTRATYQLHAAHKIYGQKLSIRLPTQPARVRINYQTDPSATGLQWLSPEQTMDKKHPFLFSQSQAIHARSWVPLQDTPAVRFTYRARVRTPKDLLARMSADNRSDDALDGDYQFRMPQPIPSYLLAIAVGKLEFRALGARSGVYAEPLRIAAAEKELSDTESMIEIAEKLYGPYAWGRYDMLVLPPSFPFGGMENPRLTFLTPTFIAGDKSLVSLIAHELAHSWSGNLVTNANWESMWLNEGFTTYVQSRIVEVAYGRERERMESALSEQDLLKELAELSPGDQSFRPKLAGRDPDDGLTSVPYDKGQWFLRWLEESYGREKFDPFLRLWFDQHAFQSVSTDQFLSFLDQELMAKYPGVVKQSDVLLWVDKPGVPGFAKAAQSEKFKAIDTLLAGAFDVEKLTTSWSTQEWLRYLNGLLARTMPVEQMQALDEKFKLTGYGNAEIAHVWYRLSIKNGYQLANSAMEAYLLEIGRRKLIVPIYSDLMRKDAARAKAIYAKARIGYHPITQATLDAIVR